jgi:uncharacterized protein (DUF433 family)
MGRLLLDRTWDAAMAESLIHDRGRGPEIVGTRITVYNLLPHFLDPTVTEEYICEQYRLTREQVAAARAYVLNHADVVLTEHMKIEERLSQGNPPEVIETARRIHERLLSFKAWLCEREASEAECHSRRPTFREWMASEGAREKDNR